MIQTHNLGKRFGPHWLFRSVEMVVEPGQVLAVLGKNGSGKSTLLKILAGLATPTEGAVIPPESCGYAALDLNLYPTLTAIEHLELSARLRGCPTRTGELLDMVNLERAGHQMVGQFSTGMRVRLKLALAIQHHPSVLLLDEPTASLDQAGIEIVDEVIRAFDGAVVMATNDDADRRWATHAIAL